MIFENQQKKYPRGYKYEFKSWFDRDYHEHLKQERDRKRPHKDRVDRFFLRYVFPPAVLLIAGLLIWVSYF